MSGPYFQRQPWPVHKHNGVDQSLNHLNEFEFQIEDTSKALRSIAVTFSDHVFTRDAELEDDPARAFPGSTREPPGHFCPTRYRHSLNIRALIEWCVKGEAWNLKGDDRYAQVPTVDEQGVMMLYSIVFSLDAVTGMPIDLHMRVRSAYVCDREPPNTFGSVRFRHLVALRAQHKRPKKVFNGKRRKPRATVRPPALTERSEKIVETAEVLVKA